MTPIDYQNATDDELDRWLAENVMYWTFMPPMPGKYIRWMAYDEASEEWKSAPTYYDDTGNFNLALRWQPTRNRDQSDMCMAKFWDRWIITLTRSPYSPSNETFWAETGVIRKDQQLFCTAPTEARVRAELAAMIAMFEAKELP